MEQDGRQQYRQTHEAVAPSSGRTEPTRTQRSDQIH